MSFFQDWVNKMVQKRLNIPIPTEKLDAQVKREKNKFQDRVDELLSELTETQETLSKPPDGGG